MTGMFPPSPTPTPPQELLWLLENPKPLLPFSFCPLQFVQNIHQQDILVGLPCTEPWLLLTTLFSWHVGATWAWWPQWQGQILGSPSTSHRIFQKQLLLSVWKLKLQADPLLSQSFQIRDLFCFSAHLQNRDAPGCPCPLPPRWPTLPTPLSSLSISGDSSVGGGLSSSVGYTSTFSQASTAFFTSQSFIYSNHNFCHGWGPPILLIVFLWIN